VNTIDDYGPPTDHPNDPRNSMTEEEEWCENTRYALETARSFINKALRVLERERYPDIDVVCLAMAAATELGGLLKTPPKQHEDF